VLEITWVALDYFSFLGDGNLEKRLAVVHRPTGIGDEAMRGAVARVDVGIDEARSH
jgi:hypothetical protein